MLTTRLDDVFSRASEDEDPVDLPTGLTRFSIFWPKWRGCYLEDTITRLSPADPRGKMGVFVRQKPIFMAKTAPELVQNTTQTA